MVDEVISDSTKYESPVNLNKFTYFNNCKIIGETLSYDRNIDENNINNYINLSKNIDLNGYNSILNYEGFYYFDDIFNYSKNYLNGIKDDESYL